MKKALLASTCAAAFAIGVTLSMSGPGFAQDNGAKRSDEKAGAATEQMQSGSKMQRKSAEQSGTEHQSGTERMNAQAPRTGEQRSNTAAEGEKNTRSNTATEGEKNTRSNTAAEGEKNTRSNTAAEGEKNTRSNTAAEGEKNTRSNTAAEGEKNTRSNTAAEGEKNTRSNAAAESQKNTRSNTAAEGEKNTRSNTAAEGEKNTRSNTAAEGETRKNNSMNAAEQKNAHPDTEKMQRSEGAQKPGMRTGEAPNQQKGATDKTTAGAAGARDRNEANVGHDRDRVRLDQRQETDLRSRLEKHSEGASVSANINVRVGAALPETVRLQELPSDVVAEYPQFRGYDFVRVRDEIVIVEPGTREVVQVIGGTEGRAAAEGYSSRRHFSHEQDNLIRKHIPIDRSAKVEFDERTASVVPDTIILEPLPEEVVSIDPDWRNYRYFVDRDDHIVVVDPDSHEVVDIID
jgi:hypothetical protein